MKAEASALKRAVFPYSFAERHSAFIKYDDEGVVLYYVEPLSLVALNEATRLVQGPYILNNVDSQAFDGLLSKAYQDGETTAAEISDGLSDDASLSALVDDMPDAEELLNAEDDAPVVRLINAILAQAINTSASDIHVETYEQRLVIRFRIDGVLNEILSPNRVLAPLLVSRLKVMAKLDIAEKRIPQDGRISVKIAGHAIDIRVSTLPSTHGERVVLRILDKQNSQLSLDQLGMSADEESTLKALLNQPHGIILVTGPTGSGKTTTLYAGLSHINNPGRSIMTIEDPVEYILPGIAQTQVHSKVGMSFATGLRAILRQDPDVVMVGEIRDIETAEIAVQASLTGHLVLSTLHTNSAVGAITRLSDMGVEPFLLSSSLVAVMAQRLVRVSCQSCVVEVEADTAEKHWLGVPDDEPLSLKKSKGCSQCNHTGYKGRRAIYEVVTVDEQLKRMIHDGEAESAIREYARQRSGDMLSSGKRMVLSGATTPEEVARVIEEAR